MKRTYLTRLFGFIWIAVYFFYFFVSSARAQTTDDYVAKQRDFRSPESCAFELRIGPYVPQVGSDAFERAYPGDDGLMLGLEIDFVALRIPDILYVGPAAAFSYASYAGKAVNSETLQRSDESLSFKLIPLSLLAVARVDVLTAKFNVPLIFTGKLGFRWNIWDSNKGGGDDKSGISPSWTWAGQIDLDLDFFDRRAARLLDEEWGINRTFLFFEIFGSKTMGNGLKVDDTTWTAGLGFIT